MRIFAVVLKICANLTQTYACAHILRTQVRHAVLVLKFKCLVFSQLVTNAAAAGYEVRD